MRIDSTINSFTAGMMSPWLKSRIDLEAYNKGALNLTNCLGRPFGGVLRRAGQIFAGETKTTDTTRLIPFTFSIEQSYIIEAGIGYFRFWKDGALIESGGAPYEITNPYTEQELLDLQYAQSRDVLFLSSGNHNPNRLERMADDDWELVDIDVTGGPFLLENTTDITIDPSAATGTGITLVASDDVFLPEHVGALWSINAPKVVDDEPIQGFVKITAVTDAQNATADVISDLLDANATEIWAEGAWSEVRGYPKVVTFHQGRLWFANTETEPQTAWGSEPLIYNNFSLEEGLQIELPSNQYNFITGLASARDLSTVTYGAPFAISSGSSTTALTTDNIQARQQGSVGGEFIQPLVIGSYTYFAQRGGYKLIEFNYDFDSDSYLNNNISLLSENLLEAGIKEMSLQKNEDNILWVVTNDGKMTALTKERNQNVQSFTLQETNGTFESVASIPNETQFWDDVYTITKRQLVKPVNIETFNGCTISGANTVGTVQVTYNSSEQVFTVEVNDTEETYDAERDIINNIDFNFIVNGVRVDVEIASFNNALDITAGDLTVEVENETVQYVEYLGQPRNTTLERGVFLDSAIIYNGDKTTELTIDLTAETATSDSAVFAESDVGEYIKVGDSEYFIESYVSDTVVNIDIEQSIKADSDVVTNEWALSKTNISGLDNLEGLEIGILRDGSVEPLDYVLNGQVQLKKAGYYVIIGLNYSSIVQTFPLEGGNRSGSSLGSLKRVPYVTLKLIDTMGIEVNGEFSEDVFDRFFTTPMGSPNPLFSGDVRVTISNDTEYENTLEIVQNNPLPMGLLSITYNLNTSEV